MAINYNELTEQQVKDHLNKTINPQLLEQIKNDRLTPIIEWLSHKVTLIKGLSLWAILIAIGWYSHTMWYEHTGRIILAQDEYGYSIYVAHHLYTSHQKRIIQGPTKTLALLEEWK